MKEQGTRIIIYNLWEDDQGDLELDFDADVHVSSSVQRLYNILIKDNPSPDPAQCGKPTALGTLFFFSCDF